MAALAVVGIVELQAKLTRLKSDLRGPTRERALKLSSLLVRRQLTELMSKRGAMDAFWGKGGAPGTGLATRSGQTKARLSPGGQVFYAGDTAYSAVGSPDKHVATLERGGTFTSSGKMFRITTAAAQTAAGVDRWAGVSIRDIPGVRLIRTSSGNLWAVQDQGRGSEVGAISQFVTGRRLRSGTEAATGYARLTFLYLLKRTITLGAHATFETARRYAEPQVETIFNGEIGLAVHRAS